MTTWQAVRVRFPTGAVGPIIDALTNAQRLGTIGIEDGARRLQQLSGYMQGAGALEPSNLKSIAAQLAMQQVEGGMADMFAPIDCMPFTPFTPNVGRAGRSHARYLSAPDIVAGMSEAIAAGQDEADMLAVLFTATSHEALSASLGGFNALLPLPDLVRTERRCGQLARLEREKWTIPTVRPGATWRQLAPSACTITKAAQAAMGQLLAPIESDAAYRDDMALLSDLVARKRQVLSQTGQALDTLKRQLASVGADASIRAVYLPADAPDGMLSAFRELESPGYEFTVCAGVLFKGGGGRLTFIRELLGL